MRRRTRPECPDRSDLHQSRTRFRPHGAIPRCGLPRRPLLGPRPPPPPQAPVGQARPTPLPHPLRPRPFTLLPSPFLALTASRNHLHVAHLHWTSLRVRLTETPNNHARNTGASPLLTTHRPWMPRATTWQRPPGPPRQPAFFKALFDLSLPRLRHLIFLTNPNIRARIACKGHGHRRPSSTLASLSRRELGDTLSQARPSEAPVLRALRARVGLVLGSASMPELQGAKTSTGAPLTHGPAEQPSSACERHSRLGK